MSVSVEVRGWWGRWRAENQGLIDEWRRGLYRFRQSRLSIVGMAIIILLLIVAFPGRSWVPYPEDAGFTTHVEKRLQGPTGENLGYDRRFGHPILIRTQINADTR